MRLRYLFLFVLFFALIPVSYADVTLLQINPEHPIQGDNLQLSVYADPFETLDVFIEFTRELPVISGNYILRVNNIEIPSIPNELSAMCNDVLTMNIAASGMTISPQVVNEEGSATIPDFPPGKTDIKISGYAASGEDSVTCIIEAWTQITTDESGEYHYSFDLGDISPGEIEARVGNKRKTATIYATDSTPPAITNYQPTGETSDGSPIVSASFEDFFGIKLASVQIQIDGTDVSSQSDISENGFIYSSPALENNTSHQIRLTVSDRNDNVATKTWDFLIKQDPLPDTSPPTISNNNPTGVIQATSTSIYASISDDRRINQASVSISLNGVDISSISQITDSSVVVNLQDLSNNTLNTIRISVSDKSGNTAVKEWTFTVSLPPGISGGSLPSSNQPPEPHINVVDRAFIGDIIRFDGSSSVDNDGIIVSYSWDLGDGTTKSGPLFNYQYTSSGKKTVKLTVLDNRGSHISTTTVISIVSLTDYSPVPSLGSSRVIFTGQNIHFDGLGSYSEGGQISTYVWDFGDGGLAIGPTQSHVYGSSGSYPVTLFVTDQRGVTGNSSIIIEVVDPKAIPQNVQDLPLQNGTIKIVSRSNLAITVSSNGRVNAFVFDYTENPFNATVAINSTGLIQDISFSDPSAITWPILVEMPIQPSSESSQYGIYWFNGTSWNPCLQTGYNETQSVVWALMTKLETSGSPIMFAPLPSPADVQVIGLSINETHLTLGDTAIINVQLENFGDSNGVSNTLLSIGNVSIPISVPVQGHQSTNFSHYFTPETQGLFKIQINGMKDEIDVSNHPADLIPLSIKLSPTIPQKGETFLVSLTVSNLGHSVSPMCYSNLLNGDLVIAQEQIGPIEPGHNSTIRFSVSLSKVGINDLTAIVDHSNLVLEGNEENNMYTFSITVEEAQTNLRSVLYGLIILSLLIGSYYQYRKTLN